VFKTSLETLEKEFDQALKNWLKKVSTYLYVPASSFIDGPVTTNQKTDTNKFFIILISFAW
jgi:hypothetical protein